MIFGQSISLPQFGNWGKFEVENTGAPSWILPQIGNWGKNLSWGTMVKSFLNWGTSVTNDEFAPIPNWGNVQLGAPVVISPCQIILFLKTYIEIIELM